MAAHIGEPSDNENGYIDHPSIKSISEKLPPGSNFPFRHTTQKDVTKIIRSLIRIQNRLQLPRYTISSN